MVGRRQLPASHAEQAAVLCFAAAGAWSITAGALAHLATTPETMPHQVAMLAGWVVTVPISVTCAAIRLRRHRQGGAIRTAGERTGQQIAALIASHQR